MCTGILTSPLLIMIAFVDNGCMRNARGIPGERTGRSETRQFSPRLTYHRQGILYRRTKCRNIVENHTVYVTIPRNSEILHSRLAHRRHRANRTRTQGQIMKSSCNVLVVFVFVAALRYISTTTRPKSSTLFQSVKSHFALSREKQTDLILPVRLLANSQTQYIRNSTKRHRMTTNANLTIPRLHY